MIPGVPTWAFVAGGLFLLVLAFWWYQERSIRGVKRRSERSSKKTATYVGAGVMAVLGALAGVVDVATDVLAQSGDVAIEILGHIGDVLIPSSPDFLAQIAITVVGWLQMRGSLQMQATTFVAVAVGVIIVAIAVDN